MGKAKKKPASKTPSPKALATLDLQVEAQRMRIAGLRPDQIADALNIPRREVVRLLERAFEVLREEGLAFAKYELDARLARLDVCVTKLMPDIEQADKKTPHKGLQYSAIKQLLEIERDRQKIILGARQVEAIDRELRKEQGGDDKPRTRINFVLEGTERPGHEVKRDDDDGEELADGH